MTSPNNTSNNNVRTVRNPLGPEVGETARALKKAVSDIATQENLRIAATKHEPLWKREGWATSPWAVGLYFAVGMFILLLVINPPFLSAVTTQMVNGKKKYTSEKHVSMTKALILSGSIGCASAVCMWALERGEIHNLEAQMKLGTTKGAAANPKPEAEDAKKASPGSK